MNAKKDEVCFQKNLSLTFNSKPLSLETQSQLQRLEDLTLLKSKPNLFQESAKMFSRQKLIFAIIIKNLIKIFEL